jgi:hypothetical protein
VEDTGKKHPRARDIPTHTRTSLLAEHEDPVFLSFTDRLGVQRRGIGGHPTTPTIPVSPSHRGRGSLLTCGDVESNPGPAPLPSSSRKRSTSSTAAAQHGPPAPPQEGADLAHPMDNRPASMVTDPRGNDINLRDEDQPRLIIPGAPCDPQEILLTRATTVIHAPSATQELITDTLADLLMAYTSAPSRDTIFGLLSFPKLVLRPISSRGKEATEDLITAIRRRISLFRKGEYATLMSELRKAESEREGIIETRGAKRARTDPASLPESTMRRVRTLVGEGAPAKALQLLLSDGTHKAADPAVWAKLQELHPEGKPVRPESIPNNVVPFPEGQQIRWEELIREAIRRFPRTSAPGPSGLRPCHLQDAIRRPGRGGKLMGALARFTELWVSGALPTDHSPLWCAANLTPLRKKDDGVRPIAVGDTLRRLVGKALLSTGAGKEQVGKLAPIQTGVGVPNAAESIAIGFQHLVQKLDPQGNWAALQLDFRNAFNSLDRTVLLTEAQTRTPTLFNYLRYAYGRPAPMFSEGRILWSTRGTQQGCPLGPVGFSVGLQPIAEAIAQNAGLLWSVWYLDDGLLVGTPAQLQQALTFLQGETERTGIQLNLDKCVLWGPGSHTVPMHNSLQVVPWEPGSGITVLGTPVDHPRSTSVTAAAWTEATTKLDRAADVVTQVADAQLGHHLIRSCLDGCRVNHLLRSSNSYAVPDKVHECSEIIIGAFEDVVGTALTLDQRLQAGLPLSAGGCGLRIPATSQGSARMAALCSFYAQGHKRVACPAYAAAPDSDTCRATTTDVCAHLGPNHAASKRLHEHPGAFTTGSADECSQRW